MNTALQYTHRVKDLSTRLVSVFCVDTKPRVLAGKKSGKTSSRTRDERSLRLSLYIKKTDRQTDTHTPCLKGEQKTSMSKGTLISDVLIDVSAYCVYVF